MQLEGEEEEGPVTAIAQGQGRGRGVLSQPPGDTGHPLQPQPGANSARPRQEGEEGPHLGSGTERTQIPPPTCASGWLGGHGTLPSPASPSASPAHTGQLQ